MNVNESIKKGFLGILMLLMFFSCGKSKEEVAKEKTLVEFQKVHEMKLNVGKRKKITDLTLELQKLPEKIAMAERNISEINQFRIGRSRSKKERQLKEARRQFTVLQKYQEGLKNEIAQLEFHKTFEFQKSPEGVMNYIFQSANNNDFSNFRYLCDPYGEHDNDVNYFGYAEMLSDMERSRMSTNYKNGRILGGVKMIGDDKAVVEYAYGPSSRLLEKMTLINRNGLWYLLGF